MNHGLWLSLGLALLLFQNAYAQKPSKNKHLEKGVIEKIESYRTANFRINAESGTPVAVYRPYYQVRRAQPEQMARQYLRENAGLFNMKTDLSDLKLESVSQSPAGFHVRFHQYAGEYPVHRASVTVTINHQDRVTFVMNRYRPGVKSSGLSESVSKEAAGAAAKSYLSVTGKLNYDKTETILYADQGKTRLAHQVSIVPAESVFGDWEILVDAQTGEIFRVEDRAAYKGNSYTDSTGTQGVGTVFNPDPLTRSRKTYGSTGFLDNNDLDSDSLTAQLIPVTLLNIKKTSGTFYLEGPYCKITDDESPFDGIFSRADSLFSCTRGQNAFEAVNTYFHIDRAMRYINEYLGVPIMPIQYTGGAQVDPHGLGGDDNSHYTPSTGKIAWGEGGVDDAEDEDVLNHELGHALHDWVTGGNLSQEDGLSEGTGDYWAASHNRSTGFWQPGDAQYHWVFQWDGHNPYWDGRVTNVTYHYPEDLNGDIYHDGAIWSSTLMQVWNAIGKEATDRNLWVALAMTDGSSNQEDAAQAFVQADIDNHGGANLSQIEYWFNLRGYGVSIPVPHITHTPLSDTENLDGPFIVRAQVTASAPLDSVLLVYGANGEFTDTVLMVYQDSAYTDTIPGLGVPAVYRYYIIAKDSMGMQSAHPGGAPGNFHQFTADADTVKPLITHTPVTAGIIFFLPVPIQADVTDNLGVDSVWIEYQINHTPFSSFEMNPGAGNGFSGYFNFDTSHVDVGDTISYRIWAMDASGMGNVSVLPADSGYYHFAIKSDTGYNAVFFDDFSSGDSNWTITNNGGNCVWTVATSPYPNDYQLPATSNSPVMAADADNCGYALLSDLTLSNPVDVSRYDSVRLEFDSDWNDYSTVGDSCIVFVSADNGAGWNRVLVFGDYDVRNTHEKMDITPYVSGSSSVKLRFRSIQPDWDWFWVIDNVKLSGRGYNTIDVKHDLTRMIPETYKLHPNYPNPFNPVTTIRYDLKNPGKVTLKVYNMLGQEVRTLVNRHESPGFKSVVWDGRDNKGKMASSGLYIYRIETGKFVKSHKMLLVK